MQKIGLIGGIGPESTVSYYRQIVQEVKEKMGEKVLPRLSIETLSAFQVFSFCKAGQFDALADYVLEAIDCLAAAGAKHAALTGNTPNVVLEKLKARSPIPLISAIDATLTESKLRNVKKIGLLGTVFTMTNTFFKIPFENSGIEIITPDEKQMTYIQDRIEAELEHGVITDATRSGFVDIIDSMRANGIEQVILGCTELPLLLNDENCPIPCLDTVKLHVASLVKTMIQA